jgi:hypothetical protein
VQIKLFWAQLIKAFFFEPLPAELSRWDVFEYIARKVSPRGLELGGCERFVLISRVCRLRNSRSSVTYDRSPGKRSRTRSEEVRLGLCSEWDAKERYLSEMKWRNL